MKITDVEIIPFYPRFARRNQDKLVRFRSINHRTIVKIKTDNGITGYGDYRTAEPPAAQVEQLIGRNPFDFVSNDLNLALGGALLDVMGKHLEVPAYKLLGPKLRDRVPVAAWSRPAPPDDLAREIQRSVAQGYTLFKMHTCEHYDVFEQNRAVEDVAPAGFKMQYDFNSNRTLATVLPLIKQLEKSPVVGFIEDPLVLSDVDGWCRLREKVEVPLIMHVPPLGGLQELLRGMADAYIVGEYCGGFGDALLRGLAYGKANVQTVVQLTGGTLTKALALHMAAVLPSCTGHNIDLDDQYEEDITRSRIPVVEGYSPVPQEPGLGYEVDEEALARLAAQKITERPRYVGVLHMPGGHTFYGPSYVSPEGEEGSVRGFSSELWEDDGSKEFAEVYERTRREGKFLAR